MSSSLRPLRHAAPGEVAVAGSLGILLRAKRRISRVPRCGESIRVCMPASVILDELKSRNFSPVNMGQLATTFASQSPSAELLISRCLTIGLVSVI